MVFLHQELNQCHFTHTKKRTLSQYTNQNQLNTLKIKQWTTRSSILVELGKAKKQANTIKLQQKQHIQNSELTHSLL